MERSGSRIARLAERRIERHGLRPRLAAGIIAVSWLVGIVVFGVVEHVVNRDQFETVWEGMWWATQTVTTVGYGDVVPDAGAGKFVAAVLMIGGLSLFAVVTGVITSVFVARAQMGEQEARYDDFETRLERISDDLGQVRALLDTLADRRGSSG